MTFGRIAITACFAALAGLFSNPVIAAGPIDEPVILVATPELRDRLYSATVLIAAPLGNGQHIGFIINHPTSVKLSEMFPGHAPSKKVTDPVFLGGPQNVEALFALVQRQGKAGAGSIKLATDLYLEVERDKVDHVIEKEHGRARFFAGVVVWAPGELEAEIRHDFWYVQNADTKLVLRKSTNGMWEELVKRSIRNKNAVTAGHEMFPFGRIAASGVVSP